MKFLNLNIKYAGRIILTWTFFNLLLNVVGLLVTKLLNKAEYSPLVSITKEFIIPIIIQTVLFSVCLIAAYKWLKNKRFIPYIFVAFQFLVFHIIFFLNLKVNHGIHFVSTFNNLGVRYLSNCGEYLVDILYLYFPINGSFENGLFMPDNAGTFYIHWILLNIVYYFALTWISVKVAKLIFKDKTKPETNNLVEAEG